MTNEYLMGILYGDGHFIIKEGRELFLFTTTHKELKDKISGFMKQMEFEHREYQRNFDKGHEKENYGTLEIIESHDKKFFEILEREGFKSESVGGRIKINPDFLRGYLETKGTFFQSFSRESEFWRIALSGGYDDIKYIKEELETLLKIEFSPIAQRKEREEQGIISKSFRIYTQSRSYVSTLVDYLYSDDITAYLKVRLDGFKYFHATVPFNMKRKVFKHYKSAVGFMARELDLTIKGVRGISAKHRQKPVFLWEGQEHVLCFNNWEKSYNWICGEYEDKTGRIPPLVKDQKLK